MAVKRTELLQDVSVQLPLDPRRCLDVADYLARHARRFGVRADIELRRNHSGRLADRHFVLCHRTTGVRGVGGPPNSKPVWIMHLILSPGSTGPGRSPDTLVTIGLHGYRRWGWGVEAGRAAQQYRALLDDGLQRAASTVLAGRHHDRGRDGNVVPLRPYADLPRRRPA